MDTRSETETGNALIDALEPGSRIELDAHLEEVELPRGYEVVRPNRPSAYCFFLIEGIASIIAEGEDEASAEVGLVGKEGVIPVAPLLDSDISPFRTVMQVEGRALRIKREVLIMALVSHRDLRRLVNRYVHALMVQSGATAFSNANHTVEQRLARWILMSHDRTRGDRIALTHDFLSIMLGVRRPSVTTALHALEGRLLIRSERSLVVVRDREGLEAFAASAYGVAEKAYRKAIGPY